jgi:hypothetical protein
LDVGGFGGGLDVGGFGGGVVVTIQ